MVFSDCLTAIAEAVDDFYKQNGPGLTGWAYFRHEKALLGFWNVLCIDISFIAWGGGELIKVWDGLAAVAKTNFYFREKVYYNTNI